MIVMVMVCACCLIAAQHCIVPSNLPEGEQMAAACRIEMELLNQEYANAPAEAKRQEARPDRCGSSD